MRKAKDFFWVLQEKYKKIFFVLIFFIALSLIFLSQNLQSIGLVAWAKVFAVVGSMLQMIVGMYFGHRIEKQQQQRTSEISPLRGFLLKSSDIFVQIQEAQKLANSGRLNDSDKIFYSSQEKCERLLDDFPSLIRISDKNVRERLGNYLSDIRFKLDAILRACVVLK